MRSVLKIGIDVQTDVGATRDSAMDRVISVDHAGALLEDGVS
jgi:hypothetical protein